MIATLTGLLTGVVHALAGPDHLAAIAPLAMEGRVRPWRAGLLWGLGHSGGVLLVGLAALLLRGMAALEQVSSIGERLVGVALVAIGLWGLRRAFSHRLHAHRHMHEGLRHTHIHVHDPRAKHSAGRSHIHGHGSFAMGVLHGAVGSAGIFAVLPALALPTLPESLLYLGMFCVGSVAAMTGYSWLIGAAMARIGGFSLRPYRFLLSGSSTVAICVGCVWLLG
jgi:hypothetical protein